MLEILESEGGIVVVRKMPKGSSKEQLLWRILHALEQLVGEQVSFSEEMVRIQDSSERTEEAESVLRRCHRRWTGSREKETEPVQDPEVAMGVALEVEMEVALEVV